MSHLPLRQRSLNHVPAAASSLPASWKAFWALAVMPGLGPPRHPGLMALAGRSDTSRPEQATRAAGPDPTQEADMERTDWLDGGFDSVEARFLMVTAITHHQFSSPIWGEDEVRKLHAELAEIEL